LIYIPRQTIVLPEKSISYERKELLLAKEKMHNVKGAQKHGALLSYYHETSFVKTKAIWFVDIKSLLLDHLLDNLPHFSDYIVQLVDADKKFICFAHHAVVLDAICDTLVQNKFR
jgi:SWI/SNF-related matrix-associated actin-dependent regulator of chromatin subfamily A-like protein 1